MDKNIRQKIGTLIKKQDTCVLATASKNRPHCSLMAYVASDSCDEIYLMTLKKGRKYQNICENPAVSVLIDTRQDSLGFDPGKTMALTLSGTFERVVKESERELIRKKLSHKHPELTDFFGNPQGEPVKINIASYLLLEGPIKSHHGDISDLQL